MGFKTNRSHREMHDAIDAGLARAAEARAAAPAPKQIPAVEMQPSKERTAAEDFRGSLGRLYPGEDTAITTARVADFDNLILAFAMKIGGLPWNEAIPLLDRVRELRDGVFQAREMVRKLVDPACWNSHIEGAPKVVIDTEFTARGNLCTRMIIAKGESDDFCYDPRSRGDLNPAIDRVLMVRDVEDLAGQKLNMFSSSSTQYNEYRTDIIELIVSAHREIFKIAGRDLNVSTTNAPFGRFDVAGRLRLDRGEGLDVVIAKYAKLLVTNEETAKSALNAFTTTFPRANAEEFVSEYQRMEAEGVDSDEIYQRMRDIGVIGQAYNVRVFSKGARNFRIGHDGFAEAAAIVERSLDFTRPGWRERPVEVEPEQDAPLPPQA